jgi:hypothetical protein
MRGLTLFMLTAATAASLLITAPKAQAQVGVEVGAAPDCPYGYYEAAPYDCAPAGYYGPEWFNDGVFIGVGPWFHGDEHFNGHVDNHFRRDHGYKGELPHRGERPDPGRRVDASHFHGNEMRDGHGRVGGNERH